MATDPRKRNQILLAPPQNAMEEEEEDEDELFEAPEAPLQDQPMDGLISTASGTALAGTASAELIRTFITPSPFPHHTSGPTSSRFRNAFTRITTNPTSDVEAWEALMTEVANCYRSIQSKVHVMDAEIQLQLDWIESCYGTLLSYFPYAVIQVRQIAEILYAQSAQVGEDQGPLVAGSMGVDVQRQQMCQAKLEHLFFRTLGVYLDGTKAQLEENNTSAPVKDEAEGAPETDKPAPSVTHKANALVGGMCTASVELWMLYIQTASRQARRNNPGNDAAVHAGITKAYELALEHCSFGFSNHIIWKAYLQYLKARVGDPQHRVNLRNLYQRLVCHPMTGLDQLWQEYEQFERAQSEALAQALIGEYTPKYQHARTVYLERNRVFNVQDLHIHRLATPPNPEEISEEHSTLQLWKTRTAYERTNPERLSNTDLQMRVRTAYKEIACVWTHHPEVWHMWSMWEETTGQGGVERAIAVLGVGQMHIPDCTLLAHAEVQLVEYHTPQPKDCLKVMEAFLERAPNTLGYALYQQMVRRYQGKEAARKVFAKARRVLTTSTSDTAAAAAEEATTAKGEGDEAGAAATNDVKKEDAADGKRVMVTNRLDASIGTNSTTNKAKEPFPEESNESTFRPGPITWHLYASHATIEHRLNGSPAIAARVYELGLRKHASFLTQPAYVLKYAQLLLELQDTVNLRALLTRALTACQDTRNAAVTALWDMTLQFEALVSIGDPTNVTAAAAVERKRRAALLGPEIEDVATGFRVGMGDSVAIGAQKSTVAEHLIRQDGYDMSSSIVNGMSRAVDVLDIMGLWGSNNVSGSGNSLMGANITQSLDEDEVIPGGKSDAAYQKRLKFARLLASGGSTADGTGGDTGSRLVSARARLQATSAPASQNTAITMAIQNSPEWLRELLLLLPASRLRTPVLSKPPPHLTEMALATLRRSKLPTERPQDDNKSKAVSGGKHKLDGDSSDEEGPRGSGGYGTQFRARQRARMASSQSNGIDAM